MAIYFLDPHSLMCTFANGFRQHSGHLLIFFQLGLEKLTKVTKKECNCSDKELQDLKYPVTVSMKILEEAPQVWTGDEEKKLQAAQEESRAATGALQGYAMLSYNQESCQEFIHPLRDKIESKGIRTWIDIKDMPAGDLYTGMAKAIEGAAIVVVGVHIKYKDSGNCQYEAEYAAKKKKRMFFVNCQPGYEADGWLGLLMGNSLWYNLAGNFEAESDRLIQHMKEIYKGGQSINQVQAQGRAIGAPKPGTNAGPVGGSHSVLASVQEKPSPAFTNWTASQVQSWMKENEIDFLCEAYALLKYIFLKPLEIHYKSNASLITTSFRSISCISSFYVQVRWHERRPSGIVSRLVCPR